MCVCVCVCVCVCAHMCILSIFIYLSPIFRYSFAYKHLSQLHICNSFTKHNDMINVNIAHTPHL